MYFHGLKENRHGEQKSFDDWLCGPIHAEATTCDEQGKGFGLLLRFMDARGRWKRWAMPMRMLSSDGQELRAELLDMGLRIDPSRHRRLSRWLGSREPKTEIVAATHTGWHELREGRAFVMPHRTIGTERVVFQHEQTHHGAFTQRGTLAAWRDGIGLLCQCNPLMVLAVSAALAGPLLKLTHRQSAGLHLVGDSSSGKSTLLNVAASVWGAPDFMRTWRATGNGLESVAAEHNDTCVILDEISEADPREIGAIVYSLGNGTGKSRASRTGGARATTRWRVVMLSSGERSVAAHMLEGGKRTKAGQLVRLMDIPAQRAHGAFDALNGFEGGRALSDHLKTCSGRCYGTLGPAFIERLQLDEQDIPARLSAVQGMAGFEATHGLEQRAATSLALIGLAGELATEYGLTGWARGTAQNAASKAFALWRANHGQGHTEDQQIIDAVQTFIDRHSEGRFAPMDALEHPPVVRDRVGWWKTVNERRLYLFTPGGLKEATQGFDFRRALLALERGGLLRRGGEKSAIVTYTPEGRKRLYHVQLPQEAA